MIDTAKTTVTQSRETDTVATPPLDAYFLAEVAAADGPIDMKSVQDTIKRRTREDAMDERLGRRLKASGLKSRLIALRKSSTDTRTWRELIESIPEEIGRLRAIANWIPASRAAFVTFLTISVLGLVSEIPLLAPVILNPLRNPGDSSLSFASAVIGIVLLGTLCLAVGYGLHKGFEMLNERLRRVAKILLAVLAMTIVIYSPLLADTMKQTSSSVLSGDVLGAQTVSGGAIFRMLAAVLITTMATLTIDSTIRAKARLREGQGARLQVIEITKLEEDSIGLIDQHERAQTHNDTPEQYKKMSTEIICQTLAARAKKVRNMLQDPLDIPEEDDPFSDPVTIDAPDWVRQAALGALPPALDMSFPTDTDASRDALYAHAASLVQRANGLRISGITPQVTSR